MNRAADMIANQMAQLREAMPHRNDGDAHEKANRGAYHALAAELPNPDAVGLEPFVPHFPECGAHAECTARRA